MGLWNALDVPPASMNVMMGGHQPEITVPASSWRERLRRGLNMLRYLRRAGAVRQRGEAAIVRVRAMAQRLRAAPPPAEHAALRAAIQEAGQVARSEFDMFFLQGLGRRQPVIAARHPGKKPFPAKATPWARRCWPAAKPASPCSKTTPCWRWRNGRGRKAVRQRGFSARWRILCRPMAIAAITKPIFAAPAGANSPTACWPSWTAWPTSTPTRCASASNWPPRKPGRASANTRRGPPACCCAGWRAPPTANAISAKPRAARLIDNLDAVRHLADGAMALLRQRGVLHADEGRDALQHLFLWEIDSACQGSLAAASLRARAAGSPGALCPLASRNRAGIPADPARRPTHCRRTAHPTAPSDGQRWRAWPPALAWRAAACAASATRRRRGAASRRNPAGPATDPGWTRCFSKPAAWWWKPAAISPTPPSSPANSPCRQW